MLLLVVCWRKGGLSLLSDQIRGFWGGQHDSRTGSGPEGPVPQVRSWETRALLWGVDTGGWPVAAMLGGCLLSCAAGVGKGRRLFLSVWGQTALLFILPTFSNPETWSSELFKATHAPFSVVPYSAYAPVMPPPNETTHVHNTVSIALCLQPPAEGLNFYN